MRDGFNFGVYAIILGVCVTFFAVNSMFSAFAQESPTKSDTERMMEGATGVGDAEKGDNRQAPRRRPTVQQPAIKSTGEGSYSLQCEWLGKRIMNLLIRDDAMAANDFTPFFIRFNCPEDHLARAFGCVVGNLQKIENSALADQITACWLDPSTKEFAPAPDGEDAPPKDSSDPEDVSKRK